VGADDQGLLDVGGLRGPGEPHGEAGDGDVGALVAFMEVVHQRVAADHDGDVLGEEGHRPVGAAVVDDPAGAVLRDPQLGGQNAIVHVAQVVRIAHRLHLDVHLGDARHQRGHPPRRGIFRNGEQRLLQRLARGKRHAAAAHLDDALREPLAHVGIAHRLQPREIGQR